VVFDLDRCRRDAPCRYYTPVFEILPTLDLALRISSPPPEDVATEQAVAQR
jgi:hypothetical protein